MKLKMLIAVLLLPLLVGCFALQEPEEASAPLVAPTIASAEEDEAPEPTSEPEPTAVPVEAPTEEAMEEPTAAPVEEPAPTDVPAQAPEATAEPVEEAAAVPANTFVIDPAQSEARFLIDEVLRGDDFTVVGTTSEVAGQVQLDSSNPSAAQIGQILINARTFVTDNNFRNNAIANRILLTDQFELITFTPTAISGLPESITEGESYPMQVTGDLSIIGTTLPVVFETAVSLISPTTLQGTASTIIRYADFGITIPASQAVQAVADELTLELDFVAVAP